MMTTSAGTVRPAKVVIMGSGVAGLQAIATAKRIGAVVYASDVRKSAEQIESVGGRFIEVTVWMISKMKQDMQNHSRLNLFRRSTTQWVKSQVMQIS